MTPELHPYAMGICIALGAFWIAMILADITDWLFNLSGTEEDKKDDA